MSREAPLITIVIPTYARPRFLGRAIDSVRAQTFERWEAVVVDDNSPESSARRETESVMEAYARDPRIRTVAHDRNRGGAAARNTGIEAARSSLVAFLDDDDEWLPTKLEKQLAVFDGAPDALCLVYTGARVVEERTGVVYTEMPEVRGEAFPRILGSNFVGSTSTILCRRDVLLDSGLFDASLRAHQDYDLYIRMARGRTFDFVGEALVVRHKHGGERITTNLENKIAASRTIYEKHRERYRREPELRATYLFLQGRTHVAAGQRGRAIRVFLRSFSADPRRVGRLPYLVAALVGLDAYEFVRRTTRPIRLWIRRTFRPNG